MFSRKYIVYMTIFVGSQDFISLPSFMLVRAVVSEIRESNRNNLQNGYFQVQTFPTILTGVTFWPYVYT